MPVNIDNIIDNLLKWISHNLKLFWKYLRDQIELTGKIERRKKRT